MPKKAKKNQNEPVSNFEFWPKPMPKKPKKNQKKNQKNQWQFGNFKKPKKPKKNQKNQCQFTDFGVATGFFLVFFFGFYWVSTPPLVYLFGF